MEAISQRCQPKEIFVMLIQTCNSLAVQENMKAPGGYAHVELVGGHQINQGQLLISID